MKQKQQKQQMQPTVASCLLCVSFMFAPFLFRVCFFCFQDSFLICHSWNRLMPYHCTAKHGSGFPFHDPLWPLAETMCSIHTIKTSILYWRFHWNFELTPKQQDFGASSGPAPGKEIPNFHPMHEVHFNCWWFGGSSHNLYRHLREKNMSDMSRSPSLLLLLSSKLCCCYYHQSLSFV
jgi:hypothetical protein